MLDTYHAVRVDVEKQSDKLFPSQKSCTFIIESPKD